MTTSIEDLFIFFLYLTDLFLLGLFIFYFNQLKSKIDICLIIVYALSSTLINYISDYVATSFTYTLYCVFTFLENLIFSYFLLSHIKAVKVKKTIAVTTSLFSLFLLIYYTTTKPRSIDSVPIGIETILLLIYSFYFLYEQLNNIENEFIYNKYSFFIITGIMIYLAGSFFIYVFANLVEPSVLRQYWFLTNVFACIKNILFAIGIFVFLKQTKKPSSPQNIRPYLN